MVRILLLLGWDQTVTLANHPPTPEWGGLAYVYKGQVGEDFRERLEVPSI